MKRHNRHQTYFFRITNDLHSTTFLIIVVFQIIFLFSSCKKEVSSIIHETGTLTDIDGNHYATVKIGDTWWMAENLRVTRYLNGDSVVYAGKNSTDTSWSHQVTGAFCINDIEFGNLYNYYAVTDSRKLAPEGWHIPSDQEWKNLECVLGMSETEADKENWRGTNEGNKLKIDGGSTSYWASSSDMFEIFGSNESGFSAKGSACRIFNGEWGTLTHSAFWWTSTTDGEEAWYRGLDYNKSNVFRYKGSFNNGFSIRCVKDKR